MPTLPHQLPVFRSSKPPFTSYPPFRYMHHTSFTARRTTLRRHSYKHCENSAHSPSLAAVASFSSTAWLQRNANSAHSHSLPPVAKHSQPTKTGIDVREWFYHIDVHGQLFLHGTRTRNFTTCFKDPKFLDFFFSRLQLWPPSANHGHAKPRSPPPDVCADEYLFASPCGREMNWVAVEDSPIVFHSIVRDGGSPKTQYEPQVYLQYAGNLRLPFDPDALYMSERTGRLYHSLLPRGIHDIAGLTTLPPPKWMLPPRPATKFVQLPRAHLAGLPPLGLIRSSLVLSHFAPCIDFSTLCLRSFPPVGPGDAVGNSGILPGKEKATHQITTIADEIMDAD
ncbi:uncharacterized protein EV422DRAFT_334288 [Fimicolochytrium jonesii]|uniref:uncharacterized protein n=1 Tax=Fimicolochytrium jonesii TaxID=1396493 RepID=UPI0022FED0A3|nr:uncharacterized protein EV422DRAFT_334288 [Fimicolochytrium jonesii]KAI8816000.1 hypothetical protein EV422DRAFT_334288 [Fimicolochytrium jonesii]